jgi:hypothetical protein
MDRELPIICAPPVRLANRRDAQRGSVVLVALCLSTILAVAVIGFFAVCARTMELSNRSYLYTSSVLLAENGMEEALWSLNQALNNSSYTWSGWTLATVNGVHTATKTLTGFTTNTGLQGSVNIKVQYYDTSTPFTQPPVITSDGITQVSDGTQIDKQLKAIVKPAALFSNAIGSTAPPNSSQPSGTYYNNSYVSFYYDTSPLVDSYDSTQNSGNYTASPSTTNRSDQAIISGPYLSLSNAAILGYAASANQNATAPAFNSSGSLKGFSTPGTTRIDTSRESNNANQSAFSIVTPSAAGSILPTSGSIGPGYYYYTGGDFVQYSGTLTITGPATIYIANGCLIEGSVNISSSSTGPVQFYIGDYVEVLGSGFNNQTKNPAYLGIFSNATSNWSYLWTSTPFYGVIYVPNGDLFTNGNGGNQQIYGSLVANHVIIYNTNFQLHYDLNLRKTTFSMVNTPYEVTEWVEN